MQKIRHGVQASILALLVSVNSGPAFAGAQVDKNARAGDCDGNSEVLLGLDNDNVSNTFIQRADAVPNQSLNNADILLGNDGCDVLIGLFGNDVLDGGIGSDILIGGTEQFDPDGFGSRDIILGGEGNDVNIWAPGDGSDAFLGGAGSRDAQVFGVIDRDSNNVPILTQGTSTKYKETGIPTAEVTGSPGFCELESVTDPELGFDYVVRFFVRARGNLAVTVRLKDVEQVFCTSAVGGQITFANLRDDVPSFEVVSLSDVRRLNRTVNEIIR